MHPLFVEPSLYRAKHGLGPTATRCRPAAFPQTFYPLPNTLLHTLRPPLRLLGGFFSSASPPYPPQCVLRNPILTVPCAHPPTSSACGPTAQPLPQEFPAGRAMPQPRPRLLPRTDNTIPLRGAHGLQALDDLLPTVQASHHDRVH